MSMSPFSFLLNPSTRLLYNGFYLFIFIEKGKEEEREGKKHQSVASPPPPPTGDMASNPGKCPDWELNRWSFSLQAGAQSTEPRQPGLVPDFINTLYYNIFGCWAMSIKRSFSLLALYLVPSTFDRVAQRGRPPLSENCVLPSLSFLQ